VASGKRPPRRVSGGSRYLETKGGDDLDGKEEEGGQEEEEVVR
jgi:hypothetical protein